MNKCSIQIYHKDWNGNCIIDSNNLIFRKDIENENGKYQFHKNKMLVEWDKWGNEEFYCYDDYKSFYDEVTYKNKFADIFIFDKKDISFIILNKETLKFRIWGKNIYGKYKIYEDQSKLVLEYNNSVKIFKKVHDLLYYDEENFFILQLTENYISETYIFNKILKSFYNSINVENTGTWQIDNNIVTMTWNHSNPNKSIIRKFISNQYSEINDSNNEHNSNHSNKLTIIKPHKIMINNRVLFGNITLCKNKIILTSIYYRDTKWFIDDINIHIHNDANAHNDINIINRKIYENDNFESAFTIILELDQEVDTIVLFINYQNKKQFKITLEQSQICHNKISAMTLFKDDYQLLKRYIKYYYNHGIEVFMLYYNGNLTHELIKFIDNIIHGQYDNIKVYLIEWDYQYWWNYLTYKHHHAQTMAINDALHILKNYSKYLLYNDLDEYFILAPYRNFNVIISDNPDIDIFIFKNKFCKMGIDLISYSEFDNKFDLTTIIEGNYWENKREKNLIKLAQINVMGVHYCYETFSSNVIHQTVFSYFYHIINFREKNREELMTEFRIDL